MLKRKSEEFQRHGGLLTAQASTDASGEEEIELMLAVKLNAESIVLHLSSSISANQALSYLHLFVPATSSW
jgi:hypothetical protein